MGKTAGDLAISWDGVPPAAMSTLRFAGKGAAVKDLKEAAIFVPPSHHLLPWNMQAPGHGEDALVPVTDKTLGWPISCGPTQHLPGQ